MAYRGDGDAVARLDGDGGAVVLREGVGGGGVEVHGRATGEAQAFEGVAEEEGVVLGRGGLVRQRVDCFAV